MEWIWSSRYICQRHYETYPTYSVWKIAINVSNCIPNELRMSNKIFHKKIGILLGTYFLMEIGIFCSLTPSSNFEGTYGMYLLELGIYLILWGITNLMIFNLAEQRVCPNSSFRSSISAIIHSFWGSSGENYAEMLFQLGRGHWSNTMKQSGDTKCCEHSFIRDIHWGMPAAFLVKD